MKKRLNTKNIILISGAVLAAIIGLICVIRD